MIETVIHKPIIDLSQNANQAAFFNEVMLKVARPELSKKKVFSYGGAIRGGKTFVSLFILQLLCKMFSGSRWHVIREDMPALQQTAIPSLEKLIGGSPLWRWSRDKSNYFAEYQNGSRIFFRGENISADPDLNDFLGLETNGILLEQLEELSQKLFNIAISRTGSWYIDPMPPGLILATFNPTQTWVKDVIYTPWMKNELPEQYHFQLALPKDNPFVTQDQWEGWDMMDERYKLQYIGGDWTNFDSLDSRWCFAFKRQKHVLTDFEWRQKFGCFLDPQYDLYLSWDFNRNPMCCSLIQFPEQREVRIAKVYRLMSMGVDGICSRIQAEFPNFIYVVNGDYSGNTETVIFEEAITNYTMIQDCLNLSDGQIQIMPNPRLEKNRTVVNSLHQNFHIYYHETEAADAIWDMENVLANADGTIDKGKPGERKRDRRKQADTLDTIRYFLNKNVAQLINIPRS